jgi:hypothetical protein
MEALMGNFSIRPLRDTDSLEALTALLHRAYAPLGAAGMNFTAVDQTVEQTRARVGRGQCFIAERGGAVVGTVTVDGASDPNKHLWARATPWFFRADVARLHQYPPPTCASATNAQASARWTRCSGAARSTAA